jgi:hypothetical protein
LPTATEVPALGFWLGKYLPASDTAANANKLAVTAIAIAFQSLASRRLACSAISFRRGGAATLRRTAAGVFRLFAATKLSW